MKIEVESIARLDVKPGETLVVKIPESLTAQQVGVVAEAVRDQLPDGVKVLVLGGSVELEVIGRTDE